MHPIKQHKGAFAGGATVTAIARLRNFLTAPTDRPLDWRTVFWLSLSLAFAAAFAAQAMRQAFASDYVVQDDARQHVFWMQRFMDPELFPRDLIADYFQSVAPAGYTALYKTLAAAGLNPMLANKLLPMLIGLVTTAFCFGVSMQVLRVPAAGFISSLLLNLTVWTQDDLVSATPRAFLYPLFLAFIYFLLRGSLAACLAAIALQGIFYPSTVFISAGVLVLRVLRLERGRPRLSAVKRDYIFCLAGLAVAVVVILIFAMKTSGFGPVITASQARALPEFWPAGRSAFFGRDGWSFWVTSKRSSLIPASAFNVIPIYACFLLPLLLAWPRRFPLASSVTSAVTILPRIAVASFVMFVAAHALLFKLHLPSRYSHHTLRIIMALAAGVALTIMLDAVFEWASARPASITRQAAAAASAALLLAALIVYPRYLDNLPETHYKVGEQPRLYNFFAAQPKDILVASLSQEVNDLPSFAARSILVGREYAIPYHTGYYSKIRERAIDLINAQYSADLGELQAFIRKYEVDFIVVDRRAFTPEYVNRSRWMMEYQPTADEAQARLKQGVTPALSKLMGSCPVFETGELVVLGADCILRAAPE